MNSLCNPEAEANLLSACITNSGEFYRLADVLDPDVFSIPENRTIWEAMLYIRNNGGDADMMAVTARLMTVDKAAFLAFTTLCTRPVTSTNGADELLTDLLVRRRTLAAIMEAQQKLMQPLEPSETTLQRLNTEIANCLVSNTTEMVTAEDACNEVMRNVFDNQSRMHNTPEIPVGLKGIDERGGLHTTDLTIIAGETSMGKTSLALTFALNAATAGVGVGVVTLETSVMQLAARMVSGDAQVSSSDILYKRLGADDYNRVGAAVERAGTLPMWFNRKAQSVAKICAWIRQLAYRKKAKLFVIDYLQLISMGKIDNRVQEIGDMSIILLSQLSRDRMNPYPSLARLRGSGEIESNADNVIFVYRPEYYKTEGKNLAYKDRFANVSTNGTAEIIVAKGRNTGTTSFIAAYEKQYTRFSDLADMPTSTMVTASRQELPF